MTTADITIRSQVLTFDSILVMGEHGNTAFHRISDLNIHFRSQRQENIDAGTEAYEAEFFILLHDIVFLYIKLYTAGHSSCYLAHEDIAFIIPYYNRCSFVFG